MSALHHWIAQPSNGTLADDMIGQASVIDGDTLEVHSTRIRLWGIDAPESTQLCRVKTAIHTAAPRKQPMTSIHSSRGGL
jgi:endonuclease YncB( thermonuclease family)